MSKTNHGFYERKPFRFEIESVTCQNAAVRPPWCWAGGREQGEHLILGGGSLDLPNRENIGNA